MYTTTTYIETCKVTIECTIVQYLSKIKCICNDNK